MGIQKNSERPELVFWLDAPPRSLAGVLKFVSEEWGNTVYYLCVGTMAADRKRMGWEEREHGTAIMTILSEQADPDNFVRNFVHEHRDAIHVCNGFRSQAAQYAKTWLFPIKDAKVVAWSERPGVYENRKTQFIKWLGISILNRYYAYRYGKMIKAYLPIGTLSLEKLAKFNWDCNIMFPFMYDSHIPEHPIALLPKQTGKPLRFLYVGRFGWGKGVDLLIQAFNENLNGEWHLSLVGRNGEYEEQIIKWANENPRVSYLGVWPSSEVTNRIVDFDVCLVPSRFDGWGLFTNEAIHAGVGVIVSDKAASFDLVQASGAGIVISGGNISSLRRAIQEVIDNPGIAISWSEKAKAYSPRITSESIGRYLIDILEYIFLAEERSRPRCPWL